MSEVNLDQTERDGAVELAAEMRQLAAVAEELAIISERGAVRGTSTTEDGNDMLLGLMKIIPLMLDLLTIFDMVITDLENGQ